MAIKPQKYLDEVNKHVAMRGRERYDQARQILSEIREAIGGEKGDKVPRKHAAHLRKKYPTLKDAHWGTAPQGTAFVTITTCKRHTRRYPDHATTAKEHHKRP